MFVFVPHKVVVKVHSRYLFSCIHPVGYDVQKVEEYLEKYLKNFDDFPHGRFSILKSSNMNYKLILVFRIAIIAFGDQ